CVYTDVETPVMLGSILGPAAARVAADGPPRKNTEEHGKTRKNTGEADGPNGLPAQVARRAALCAGRGARDREDERGARPAARLPDLSRPGRRPGGPAAASDLEGSRPN